MCMECYVDENRKTPLLNPLDCLENHTQYQINRRPSQIKNLSKSGQYKAKKREHAKSSVRCKVEHVFGVVKGLL